MASIPGTTHGGTRQNSGGKKMFSDKKQRRKSWGKAHRRIYLTLNIFKTWSNAKIMAGYE
jgi:hypothetical protein